MQTTSENFRVLRLPDQLIVSLRRRPGVLALLTATLTFGAIAVLPLMGILAYHYALLGNSVFLGLCSLGAVPFFYSGILGLRPRPLVLDRSRNQVSIDGKGACDLSDLCQVEVNRYSFQGRKVTSSMTQLNLIIGSDRKTMVWESIVFSAEEMETVGQAVADFAGVELACSSENPYERAAM